MSIEENGIVAGSGLLGAIIGGLGAFFGLRERVAVQDQKIKDSAKLQDEKIKDMARLVEDLKRNIEISVTRIETAHERHTSLVVYKDTCIQCSGRQNAQLLGISEKLDIVAENLSRRREDKKRD